jgi:rRNA maturation endonuclease Nob1
MQTAAERINETTVRGHSEHKHVCGRCGHTLPMLLDNSVRRCGNCGADLMTMAECVEDQEDSHSD